jgi:hypothetical protein
MPDEPFAARLHPLAVAGRDLQNALVRALRRYFERAPGWLVEGRAEVIEDLGRKLAIATAHPFFPPAPFAIVHALLRTLLRPLLVAFLGRWVRPRPIVLIRPRAIASPTPADPAPGFPPRD